ncbi:hypothetical protein Goklo_024359 [Gossypium klotzschianum]|uniref:Uncharacterized protein n=1 Tax=Gossypium klotzschianum TaxID=34286 RepID=A0A7J8WAM9_9ROSI|nr:hypothetical protein [Gossypium klotzschianum]
MLLTRAVEYPQQMQDLSHCRFQLLFPSQG